MKRILFIATLCLGVFACSKQNPAPISGDMTIDNGETIQLRSQSNLIAYVGSNNIVYPINDPSEIPALEAFIQQQEQDILAGAIGRPKYPYQSENCVVENGLPGLECHPKKKGDCTSEFDCIISYGGY